MPGLQGETRLGLERGDEARFKPAGREMPSAHWDDGDLNFPARWRIFRATLDGDY
jgi:hypothetical protein